MLACESAPSLAAVIYERGFDVDGLLLASCKQLRSIGFRIGGVIQRSTGRSGQCVTSVHVVDVSSGNVFDIWENRGACASGCRLDGQGLIDAEPGILAAIADGVDLLVINRFGRAESLGRGLIDCFAAALEAGIPVLTAVRAPYEEAWNAFHGGLAQSLRPGLANVINWSKMATRKHAGTVASQSFPAAI